jgi:hypothetical protein
VEVRVKISSQMNFELKYESFRIRGNSLKLPLFAAVCNICKDLAGID